MAGIVASSSETATPRSLTVRPSIIGTLLWLRWTLLLRAYARSTGRIIGTILFAIVILPVIGGVMIGLIAGFQNLLPGQQFVATNVLIYLLAGLYIAWAILPLLQFSVNESMDITKLTTYPVTQPELMIGLLLSTLLDISTLAALMLFIGIGIGWAHSIIQGVLIGLVLILVYVHFVAISQLLLSSLLGLLQSRRWRDLSLIIFTALALSCSLGSQFISRANAHNKDIADFFNNAIHFDIGTWLQYLPPGMAGRAIVAIYANDYLALAGWAAALLISAIVLLWGWSTILQRAITTPDTGGNKRVISRQSEAIVPSSRIAISNSTSAPTRSAPASLPTQESTSGNSWLPETIMAIAGKDFRAIWRDPNYKRLLLSGVYWIGLVLISAGSTRSAYNGSAGQALLYFAVIMFVLQLSTNTFGYEGPAITTLSIFPIRPLFLFIGKNIPVAILGIAEGVVLLVVQAIIGHAWQTVGSSLIALIGTMLVALGLGNLQATIFPARVLRNARAGQQQTDPGSSFGTGCIRGLAYIGTLILALPVAAANFVPVIIHQPELVYILLPIGLLYGIGLYIGGTAIAASMYYRRLPDIINTVARE
jgi:ABC-2 type transport system permease protein